MKKRILAAVLALSMVVALVSSCGDKDTTSTSTSTGTSTSTSTSTAAPDDKGDEIERVTEITLPIAEEPMDFTSWRVWSNQYMTSYNEVYGVQELAKLTNINVEFTCVPPTNGAEKFGLLIASGDYPSMIEGIGNNAQFYPGGEDAGVADGIFRDLTEAVWYYMPNYYNIVKTREDVREIVISDEGRNVGIYMIRAGFQGDDAKNGTFSIFKEPAWQGLAIREDWLKEANMEVPTTIDELYDALVYFRDAHGAWMEVFTDGTIGDDFILSAYGVTADFYLIDGGKEVGFGPITDEYKQYVTLMRDWYKEGLINPDFISTSSTVNKVDNEYFANGKCGVGMAWQGTIGRYFQVNGYVEQDDDMYLAPMAAPVLKEGDTINTTYQSLVACMPTWVTTSVTDEELPYLAQWMDFRYTYDYAVMNGFGVEGVSYEIDPESEWYFIFTDKVTNAGEGISATAGRQLYAIYDSVGLSIWQAGWQLWGLVGNDWSQKAYETWANQTDRIMLPMNAAMTTEESYEYNEMFADIETYVAENTVMFIVGTLDIEKDWDNYVSTIESMNIARCVELKQASVDRYYGKTWLLEGRE